jgi:hypothetical protein
MRKITFTLKNMVTALIAMLDKHRVVASVSWNF